MNREEESRLNKLVHDKLVQIKELNINVKNCSRKDLDPTSPLFSLKTFDELRLRKELLQGVANMGFSYPSKIQEATLPVLLADPPQNIIAQSQSGTGKTAAFVLTMLSRVEASEQYPQCLCLAPTYELALQIGQIVETMGKFCSDIKVAYAVRGARSFTRGEKIKEHIIIGTPGTALDWCLKFKCFDPKLVRVFVLDEADIMISQQ
uniref:RNA helicase n=1 Tax=Romanomermis culicivorax TaxID=13658 RepID=A0A915JAB1_ROMCU